MQHGPAAAWGLLPLAAALALAALWVPPLAAPAAPELLAAINGLRLDVGALGAQLRSLDEKFGKLDEKVGALDEKFGALDEKVGEQGSLLLKHGAQLTALDEKVGALDEKVGEHGAQLTALAETAVTPAVGARLEACDRASVVAAFIFLDEHPARVHEQCSAVPLPGAVAAQLGSLDASTSTYFLTAAHCFMKHGEVVGVNVTLSYLRVSYACGLLESFAAPAPAAPYAAGFNLDLAILRCHGAVPVAPTRLSSILYAAHTPAVLVGFARGLHLDHAMTAGVPDAAGVEVATYALHTRVSRLSSSFRTPVEKASVSGCCGAQGAMGEDGPSPAVYSPGPWSSSLGFLDLSPRHERRRRRGHALRPPWNHRAPQPLRGGRLVRSTRPRRS